MATIRNGNGHANGQKKKKFTLSLPRTAKLSNEAIFKAVTGNIIKNQIPKRKILRDGHLYGEGNLRGRGSSTLSYLQNPIQGIIEYGMDERGKKLGDMYAEEERLNPKKAPSSLLEVKRMLPKTKKSFFREALKQARKLRRK